jgi:hypothetical protein
MKDEGFDECPRCHKKTMYKWETGGRETARMCQDKNCNFVESKSTQQKEPEQCHG